MHDLRIRTLYAGFFTLLLACAGTPTNGDPPSDGGPHTDVVVRGSIEYRGDVMVMESFPVQLSGSVTITNVGSSTQTVTFPDGCVALLRAYRAGDSTPIWDQGSDMACTMALVPVTLDPGESETVRTPTSSAYDILGDQHPDGDYRITIYLRPLESTPVEVEGGTTQLAIPR